MKKALKKELSKLDRVGVMTLKKQMEIAEWMFKLIDEGATEKLLAEKMRIKDSDVKIYMTGAKSFKLSHIAGLTATSYHLNQQKVEADQIVFTK